MIKRNKFLLLILIFSFSIFTLLGCDDKEEADTEEDNEKGYPL